MIKIKKLKIIFIFFIIAIPHYFFEYLRNKYILETENNSNKIDKYYKICNGGILINKKNYKKVESPKISIISPIHNREEYILKLLRSIQNQYFDDIEIIFVDDFSTDGSVKLIKILQNEDKRIILLKHKRNKGTLISRNYGALFAKGEYIMFPDPDDILSNDILLKCYKIANKNNYELIRYNIYFNNNLLFNHIVKNLDTGPIYQPELSSYLFYGKGIIQQLDFNVANKFIKRITFIKALSSMNKHYFYLFMRNQEDGLINFLLYRNAKSYFFLKKIGYYYLPNKQSFTINYKSNLDETIQSAFINLIFVYENTKNNKHEKNMVNCLFRRLYFEVLNEFFVKIKKDFDFYINIINEYLSCKFISKKNKYILNKFKFIILNKKNDQLKKIIV